MDTHILLVEDDNRARMLLAEVLVGAGHRVTAASNGEAALELLEREAFDIVITDIKMRRVDGLQVLTAARRRPQPPEVILLTGFGSLESSVAALRTGAYDYLLKPCAPPDLLACVAGALKRHAAECQQARALRTLVEGVAQLQSLEDDPRGAAGGAPAPSEQPERYLRVGALRIDCSRHTINLDGTALHVTPIEYALLRCLAEEPGQVLGYTDIVRRTHGHTLDEAEAQMLLKAHVRNLRRKIGPAYLINMRGAGYMLIAPQEPG